MGRTQRSSPDKQGLYRTTLYTGFQNILHLQQVTRNPSNPINGGALAFLKKVCLVLLITVVEMDRYSQLGILALVLRANPNTKEMMS